MKTILTVSFLFIYPFLIGATTRTVVGNSGQGWSVAGNWSPATVPQDGDTVVIPSGITISVKTSIYNSTPNLIIRVFGTLNFSSGGKLDLGINSEIIVYADGFITSAGSPSEVIKINNVSKYKGSTDGTIVGPAYSDRYSSSTPNGFSLAILPVKFQSFVAKTNGYRQVQLTWMVSDENQITGYTIEKSNDAINWIAFNKQTARNSNQSVNTYFETDQFLPPGKTYYRIKAEENTGQFFYSKTEIVEERVRKGLTIYPNPVTSVLHLNIDPSIIQGAVTITLYTSNSVRAEQLHFDRLPASVEMDVSHLPKGNYRIVLIDGSGAKHGQSIIIR